MKKTCFLLAAILAISAVVTSDERDYIKAYWMKDLEPFTAENFISPETCGQCHDEIYEMWDGSLHSLAFDDPLFRAASKLFVSTSTHPGEREDAEHCVSCHNPIAYRSGRIKGSSDDYGNVDDVTSRSLSCDLCHTIDEIVRDRNASFNTSPGKGEDEPGVKLGPRDDSEPMFHDAGYSAIHTSSILCGTCHNVTHLWYMTKLEGTYEEWYHSPYNSLDPSLAVTCQDCHMRQSEGHPSTGMTERPDYPGRSASMGEERPHVYRHSVIGGNAFVPGLLGHPERHRLAVERLENAAVLEIFEAEMSGNRISSITVRVKNEGAGHMLPTGVTEFRQMWLEVSIRDAKGAVVFTSGGVLDDGSLAPGTRLFGTVFGDPEGNPTINVSEAACMLSDHRVPPKGRVDETFTLDVEAKKPLTVHAELKYRSMEPSLVNALLGGSHDVPVILMTEVETVIE